MAITLKSTNTSSTTTDNTTFTATNLFVVATGTDRFLTCCISAEDGTDADLLLVSVVVDPGGVNKALTNGVEVSNGGAGFSNSASIWYLKDADFPANGTYDVVTTYTGQVTEYGITANVYEGVDSTSPEASGSNALKSVTQVSAAITTVTNGAWIVDCCSSGDGVVSISPDSPQISRNVTDVDSHWHGVSDIAIATAAATSTDWTAASFENRLVLANLALKPKGAAAAGIEILRRRIEASR